MTIHLPLAGRHAVVTGGAGGIGYAVASQLLQAGAVVTLMGRTASSLESAATQLSGLGHCGHVVGDIADADEIRRAFTHALEARGVIDILVSNAGQALSQRFDRIDAAHWQQMIAVNLTGTFHCMQAALPGMQQQRWGRIVNVASSAGLTGYPYVSAYCAAKHGVVGLTRALAQEVASQGITVNAVCPGYTDTGLVHDAIQNIAKKTGLTPEHAIAKLVQRNPQGRLVQPQEVADAVVWLCMPGASAVNGQAIPVDGGELMAG